MVVIVMEDKHAYHRTCLSTRGTLLILMEMFNGGLGSLPHPGHYLLHEYVFYHSWMVDYITPSFTATAMPTSVRRSTVAPA